jgi:asparagine synthase (glutamine-hydrolysing)
MDQPTVDGVNTYVVSQVAHDAGLKVVLSGLGSDEIFGGYETFRSVPRMERVRSALPPGAGPLASRLVRALPASDRRRKLARWLSGEGASAYVAHRELFSADMRARLVPADGWTPPIPPTLSDAVNAVSHAELTGYMRNILLRDSDVMSMAHSLELRVPFLDHRLVEFVAALPGELKVNARGQKPLLRDALGPRLPESTVTRPKRGFTFPFSRWLRSELKPEVEGVLRGGVGATQGLVDHRAVAEVWEGFLEGRIHWSRPWSLYVLERWAERHVADGP